MELQRKLGYESEEREEKRRISSQENEKHGRV